MPRSLVQPPILVGLAWAAVLIGLPLLAHLGIVGAEALAVAQPVLPGLAAVHLVHVSRARRSCAASLPKRSPPEAS